MTAPITVFLVDDHGAAGYLLKSANVDEIADAILAVARGEVHLDAEAAAYLMREQADLRALTPRELEVLGLLAEGAAPVRGHLHSERADDAGQRQGRPIGRRSLR